MIETGETAIMQEGKNRPWIKSGTASRERKEQVQEQSYVSSTWGPIAYG